jgi:hypothetical protein
MESIKDLLKDFFRKRPKIKYNENIADIMILLPDMANSTDPFTKGLREMNSITLACPLFSSFLELKRRLGGITTIPESKIMLFYGGILMDDLEVKLYAIFDIE